MQCLEAQTILSNIFDKIDTQSIQDDEVFEGFANEQDNYNNEPIKQSIKTVIGAKTATETANSIVAVNEAVHFKTIEQTYEGALNEEEEVEAKTEKSTTNGNNSNNNNGEYFCAESMSKCLK